MIVAAATMHVVERESQPDKFGSIPESMYWAIITLTTVGYGDVYPVTKVGRFVAGVTAVMGLVMLSLPVGIIATSFAEVIHRRDFVVTWTMVARVPIFSRLKAGEIADIMQYLRARVVEPGQVIVRRDEPAHSMYFISSGAVDIDWQHRRIRLEEGHFFGEAAILRAGRRTATVRAVAPTRLLMLDRDDFLMLMAQDSDPARHIHAAIAGRPAVEPLEPGGDLAKGEIEPDPRPPDRPHGGF
jgi:voltage-gated potassium channel